MATKKNTINDETTTNEASSAEESPKKSSRKSSKPAESDGPKSKRSYSWRSKTAESEPVPAADPDLRDLRFQEGMRYNQDTRQRKTMVRWVAVIISIWLGIILVILCLKGSSIFQFDPSEVIALLTTTTANVIALGYIVLKGLFGDVSMK